MNAHRTSRCIVSIAVLALASLLAAARTADAATVRNFRLKGDYLIVVQQGTQRVVDVAGRSSPGGSFTGQFVGKQFHNADVAGTVTLDYGGGNTLTYYQELSWDPSVELLVGTYTITGGTGRFAGATGSGYNAIVGAVDSVGTFELRGTISY